MSNYKQTLLTDITGFATRNGTNTRDHLKLLGGDKYVTFRSELNPDLEPDADGNVIKDERIVLTEMVLGDTATKKSRAEFVELLRTSDNNLYGLAMSIHSKGQQQAIGVGPMQIDGVGGLGLVWGARRYLAFCCLVAMGLEEGKFDHIGTVLVTDEDTDAQSITENLHRSEVVNVDQGKQFYDYKVATGLSWQLVASKFDQYTPAGKPNIQHVQRYAALWDENITQATRDKVATGKTTIEAVLNTVKEAKAAEKAKKNGEVPQPAEKKVTRKTSMSYKAVMELVNDQAALDEILAKIEKKMPEATNLDILRWGLFTAAKETRYKKIKAQPKAEVVTEDADDAGEAESA